jgi:xylulokinase
VLIAHDLGTTGDKASLHALDGTLIASATASYPTMYGTNNEVEQNPEDWWVAVVTTTHQLLADTGTPPSAVTGMCVGGTMMAVVLVDATGTPLRPSLIWADQRAAEEAKELRATFGDDEGYQITGNRLAATYNLPKLMWLTRHEPDLVARAYRAIGHKDYVNFKLTGIIATDVTDASSTAMYDIAERCWSDDLFTASGVESRLAPLVVDSTSTLGPLTSAAAAELGLTIACRVIAGGGDGPMAAAGVGCISPDQPGYVCLGTSAWYSRTTRTPVLDPLQRSFTLAHVVPGMVVPTATTQAGAGTIDWLRDSIAPELSVPDFIEAGLGAEAASTGLFFLPYLTGERSPWWNPHASGVMAGLRRHHGRAEMTRAALEGVAFGLALCMEPLVLPDEPVDVVGGGAASDGWLQLFADVWERPVRRRANTAGVTSLGVAITGLVGLGHLDFASAPSMSVTEFEAEPTSRASAYREHRERFVAAYVAVAPWFEGEAS